jgi:hypothetical protein
MCTYQQVSTQLAGSGKGPAEWIKMTEASVYLDHPVHADWAHTLNIDVRNPALGPSARVALELEPRAAHRLATAILTALRDAPAGLITSGVAGSDDVVSSVGGGSPEPWEG